MDRSPTVRALLAEATMDELLSLREVAWQAGLWKLCRAAATEIRRRTTSQIKSRLRPYKATLRRVP